MAVATTCTAEVRMPAMISGMAIGSSTCHSTCRPRMPMPSAAWRTSGSTERTPM